MFSGIVEELAQVVLVGDGKLAIKSSLDHRGTAKGDSICINGVCLTVVQVMGSALNFDLAPETLRRSNLGDLKIGDRVNLERSLKLGDRISGHFVFGHIDAVLALVERRDDGNSVELWFSLPKEWQRYVVPKGSISLSGVSLTVGSVKSDRFCVWIVPHTGAITTLGTLQVNDRVNFEVDMLARYAVGHFASERQTC